MCSTRQPSGLPPLLALSASTAPQLPGGTSRPGEGEGMGCTPPPSQTQGRGRQAAALGVHRPPFAHSPGPGFSHSHTLLPRPKIMYDRPSATQHCTVLVGHLPKAPFAPGHSAQRPDQGVAKTLQSSCTSGVSEGLIPKRAPTCPISAWPESSSQHPNQHIQPSDQVSCTSTAALSQMQLLQAHSPVHTRHKVRATPSPT